MEAAPTGAGSMLAKYLLRRAGEPRRDRRMDGLERHRRQAVLQSQQVVRRVLADQVGTGGERLAQLDRGGADRLERVGVARHPRHARAEASDAGEAADGGGGGRVLLDPAQGAVAREDPAPSQEPPQVRDG